MTSQQIEYVLTLANQGSFSKAARQLSVSQPSLSQYIINIENQLGTPLFDRSVSPIQLTAAGEAYVRTAVQVKALEENLKNEIADMENLKTGTLRLGTTIFRAYCMLPKSIAEFCRIHSGVKVSLTEDSSRRLLNKMLNGEIDVFIGTGDYDTKFFDSEPLADERLLLAVPTDNPINEKLAESRLTAEDICVKSMKYLTAKPINLSLLSEENIIVCDDGMEFTSERIDELFAGVGITPNYSMQVRSVESAFSFVKAGLGVSFLPDSLIRFGDFLSHPYYYPLPDSLARTDISLVYRKNGFLSRAAKEYSLILKRLVSSGTWKVL